MQAVTSTVNSITNALDSKRKSSLDMESFIKLLTVQLQTQDPLEPMNDRDFFAQLAQLGQVQGIDQLNDSSSIQQAQSMIDNVVTGNRPNGDLGPDGTGVITGTVRKVSKREGDFFLGVEDANGGLVDIKLSSVQSVVKGSDPGALANYIGKTATFSTALGQDSGVVKAVINASSGAKLEIETSNGLKTVDPNKILKVTGP